VVLNHALQYVCCVVCSSIFQISLLWLGGDAGDKLGHGCAHKCIYGCMYKSHIQHQALFQMPNNALWRYKHISSICEVSISLLSHYSEKMLPNSTALHVLHDVNPKPDNMTPKQERP